MIEQLPYEQWNEKKSELEQKYGIILLSDVLYKKEQWEKFNNWFEEQIKPFRIFIHDDNKCSVLLDQDDYWYDWISERKTNSSFFGDGHDYENAFKEYLDENFNDLNKKLKYDSENGMFCVYCDDIKDAEIVSYELSLLYKDEEKMINLIKNTKEKYYYEQDIKI